MKKNNLPQVPVPREVEFISKLLDSQFRIPGTKFTFGLDPIIGLIPGIGDGISLAISLGLILYMMKQGASRKALILMIINVFLDATIGSIPILGSIFDFFYHANTKNIRIFKDYYQKGKYQGSGTGIILIIFFVFVLFIAFIVFVIVKLVSWLIGLF